MIDWLERHDCGRRGLSSNPTRVITLCPWEKHFTTFSSAWWSRKTVLNFSHIFIKLKKQNKKLQANSNILASPKADRGDCLPYVYRLRRFPASQEDKCRYKMKKDKLNCYNISVNLDLEQILISILFTCVNV